MFSNIQVGQDVVAKLTHAMKTKGIDMLWWLGCSCRTDTRNENKYVCFRFGHNAKDFDVVRQQARGFQTSGGRGGRYSVSSFRLRESLQAMQKFTPM